MSNDCKRRVIRRISIKPLRDELLCVKSQEIVEDKTIKVDINQKKDADADEDIWTLFDLFKKDVNKNEEYLNHHVKVEKKWGKKERVYVVNIVYQKT